VRINLRITFRIQNNCLVCPNNKHRNINTQAETTGQYSYAYNRGNVKEHRLDSIQLRHGLVADSHRCSNEMLVIQKAGNLSTTATISVSIKTLLLEFVRLHYSSNWLIPQVMWMNR
jgi:hypothetical protein